MFKKITKQYNIFNLVHEKLDGERLLEMLLGFGFYYSLVTYGIDLLTGGLWKPDTYEKGIRKINFNHYVYSLNYTPTENKNSTINTRVTLYLKSGTILNGKIIEISNSNLIKFETELGNVFIINQEDIERKEFK